MESPPDYLVLYDGHCGFCHRATQFILPRDADGRFHFAPLQSRVAAEIFTRHNRTMNLDTFIVVQAPFTPQEHIAERSRAALQVGAGLGGMYRLLATLGRVVPRFIADAVYGVIAANRYRLMGKKDACLIPPPEHRARFVGLDDLVA